MGTNNNLWKLNVVAAALHGLLGLLIVIWLSTGQISPNFELDAGEYQGKGLGREIVSIPPSFLVLLLATFTSQP
jgi:hypothetical protein